MSISPPRPKGPPLNALRAFEASARLGGFARAAEELFVSPGAVSQHIKTLEDWAGVALFERQSHGVRLSSEGQRLAARVTQAFDMLGLAVQELRDLSPDKTIQIAALPSIAQLWLPPRMAKLRADFSDTRLSVTAMEQRPNLKREVFDITLFFTVPSDERGEHILAQDIIFPVCSPQIASRLNDLSDLRHETLLLDASWQSDWTNWSDAVDLDLPNIRDAAQYSLYALALEEARNSAGVLIGHQCLVAAALADGSLVAPFYHQVSTGRALVMTSTHRSRDLAQSIERLAH